MAGPEITLEKITLQLRGAISNHKSRASHPNLEDFISSIAHLVLKLSESHDKSGVGGELELPIGWRVRDRNASVSLESLAHALEGMSPTERAHWVPPSEYMMRAVGAEPQPEESENGISYSSDSSLVKDVHLRAVDQWIQCTLDIARLIKARNTMPRPKRVPRSEQIAFRVNQVRDRWFHHFGEEPNASANSPFVTVVEELFTVLDEQPPAHQTIRSALSQH